MHVRKPRRLGRRGKIPHRLFSHPIVTARALYRDLRRRFGRKSLRRDAGALIAGDLNMDASSGPAADALKNTEFRNAIRLPNVRTRPSRGLFDGARTIDWVFVTAPLKCSKGRVHSNVRGSDHWPLSLRLAL